ncbi:hypothetical protein [Clostridium sp. WB02_MRS01]|uniref:hypothetical protein n=1 Tax=Clostridium sp. WB02_MRS01 TaxID=2605777 RepID=UPI00336BB597
MKVLKRSSYGINNFMQFRHLIFYYKLQIKMAGDAEVYLAYQKQHILSSNCPNFLLMESNLSFTHTSHSKR